MNFKDIVKQIFGNVSRENFAQAKLDTGQLIEAESFEPGNAVYLVTPEGDMVALGEGEYLLEDGNRIMVDAEGLISEFIPGTIEAEDGEDEEKEEMNADAPEYATKAELAELVEKLNLLSGEIMEGFKALASESKSAIHSATAREKALSAELENLKERNRKPERIEDAEEKQKMSVKLPEGAKGGFIDPVIARVRENLKSVTQN